MSREKCPFCKNEINEGACVCASCGAYRERDEYRDVAGGILFILGIVIVAVIGIAALTVLFPSEMASLREVEGYLLAVLAVIALIPARRFFRKKTVYTWCRRR